MKPLLLYINELYGPHLQSSEKVTKGYLSENHILFDGKTKYFLKRYRFDNKERIEEIHSVKKYFANGGIPVILPIADKEGNTFFFFDDAYFALFPFISGKQLERSSLTYTAIRSLAEMLGKIHLLGKEAKNAGVSVKEKFTPWDKQKALDKIDAIRVEINKKTVLTSFDKLALKSIETKSRLIQENSMTYEDVNLPSDHLIHGDYLDQNVFFDANDRVSYVFDFEKTDYSPRMYELFRSLMYSLVNDDTGISKAKLYLDSYLTVYPTSKDELSRGLKLFYLKSIHGVWIESEHYLKNNDRADGFLSSDFKRIEYLSKHFKEFEGELLR